MMNSESAMSK